MNAFLIGLVSLAGALFALQAPAPQNAVPQYGYKIIHVYPHDPQAFTQGLEYHDRVLYEGTGLEGESTLRKETLETGKILQEIHLDARFFGEGITVFQNRILELTWQAHFGYVWDQASLHLLRTFSYTGEGWGLANDGKEIFLSDGSPVIRVLDPQTLEEKRRLRVLDGAVPVEQLNELECVEGELYANVWQTDRIARISPEDGRVLGWINLAGLLAPADKTTFTDVLNGIAYDAIEHRLFVTGKRWPKLFQIQLVPERS